METHLLFRKRAGIAAAWLVMTGCAVILSLSALGIVRGEQDALARDDISALAQQDLRNSAILAATGGGFDLVTYPFLTATGGTPGWRETVEAFGSAQDFYGWLDSDRANALDARNDHHLRAVFADDYAVTYGTAVTRGLDLSAFDDPATLRAVVQRDR